MSDLAIGILAIIGVAFALSLGGAFGKALADKLFPGPKP